MKANLNFLFQQNRWGQIPITGSSFGQQSSLNQTFGSNGYGASDALASQHLSLEYISLFKQDVEEINRIWGSNAFSSMSTLRPNQNFIFLVHAIQPRAIRELRAFELKREGYVIGQMHLPENPWKISGKDLISCSVISNEHVATFTDYGFILDAPAECFRNVEPEDSHSKPSELGELSWQDKNPYVGKYIKSGPQGLLIDSKGWNEVNLTGTSKDGTKRVKPIGIFIKCKNDKPLIDQEDLELMKRTCFGLPVILIDKQSGNISKIVQSLEEI